MADNLPAVRSSNSPNVARAEVLSRSDERIPRTEYVLVQDQDQAKKRKWSVKYVPQKKPDAATPRHVPRIMGNRQVVAYAWMIAMILVSVDEWKNHGILPRPARLWDTSVVFGLLTLLTAADALVPLANALAIGYVFMLAWQYFNGEGQFTK